MLTDGSGSGDANNTATLSHFLFGGARAGSVDASLRTGGAGGDLISGVSLVDSSFLNIFASTFTPGNALSLDLGLTTNLEPGGTPDQFSMVLLNADGSVVGTTDPTGANSLLTVNLDSPQPVFMLFASELTPAPVVTHAVPEPSILALFGLALLLALRGTRTQEWPRKSGLVFKRRTCADGDVVA